MCLVIATLPSAEQLPGLRIVGSVRRDREFTLHPFFLCSRRANLIRRVGHAKHLAACRADRVPLVGDPWRPARLLAACQLLYPPMLSDLSGEPAAADAGESRCARHIFA